MSLSYNVRFNYKFHLCSIEITKSSIPLELRKEKPYLTRFDTNQAVQPQKIAIGLKVQGEEGEGVYYLCSENKAADQLHNYHSGNLRLCLCICKMQVFFLFRMTKEFVQTNQDGQVKKILKILGEDFAGSSNPNTRKGGLIGLAAAAIALGKVFCTEEQIRFIFDDYFVYYS